MTLPASAHRPKILCLHGFGTSKDIFQVQSRAIRHALRHHFEFVFVNAPYPSPPGPGVLPYFQDEEYFSWIDPSLDSLQPGDAARYCDPKVWSLLTRVLTARDGTPFVGVMGFSQGARLAAGLMQRQQYCKDRFFPKLRFAILFSGTCPPLDLGGAGLGLHAIHVPTLHVIGTRDRLRAQSEQLALYFDPERSVVIRGDHGHWLPGEQDINARIAAFAEATLRGRGSESGPYNSSSCSDEVPRLLAVES